MIKELDRVVLNVDLPEHGLTAGDVGTVVMVYAKGKGFEVEFMTLDGMTVAVITLIAGQIRPAQQGEISHVRKVAGF